MVLKSLLVACLIVVGCAAPSGTDGGTGGGTATGGGTGTGGGSGATGGGSAAPCALTSSCVATDKTCVGLVDNSSGTTFGLRINSLKLTRPVALTTGIVSSVLQGNFVQNLPACNQSGSGTANWLLNFDTSANTLTLGGAKAVTDPTLGYAFDNENFSGVTIAPVSLGLSLTSGAFSGTSAADTRVVLPIFLNEAGTSALLIPLINPELRSGALSSNRACVGTYNADGLSPTESCQPNGTTPGFISGAELHGYFSLEDADTIVVSALSQTLCVVLTGNASMYGTQSGSTTVCKRDGTNHIVFAGDWCSTSNSASGCTDSVEFSGQFAAGSVAIH